MNFMIGTAGAQSQSKPMKNVGDGRATEIKGFKNRNTVNERHNFTETLRKNKREEMQKLKRSKMTNSQNTNNGTNS